MRYIFVNCIADGPVNWKAPLTARGQPGIREYAYIVWDAARDVAVTEAIVTDGSVGPLRLYSEEIALGGIVIGHSVEYHHGHLRARMIEIGTDPCDGRTRTICTMLGLTGHVQKRNGRRGWPTFDEACDHFGVTRAGHESAEDNARCLLQVFQSMERAGIVPEPRIWRERNA